MRGKIIQYNGADGTGTIVADGKQYRFELAAWRGNSAPAVNKTVELTLDGEAVTAVTMVGEDVLIKEKAAELSGKLGAMLNKASAKASATVSAARTAPGDAAANEASTGAGASPVAEPGAAAMTSIVDRYGKLLLAAYVLMLLGTLAFNAISMSVGPGVGRSLFDVASLMSKWGSSGGGMIKVLLLAGYASIVLPHFWRDRRAWLALSLPLVAVLWAVFSALHSLRSMGGGDEQVSSMVRNEISQMISVDFGFYLSLLAALALTVLGIKRFLASA